MSIMVGATTHKFLMIAAAMCLPAKVNRERVEAVIDDNVPVSVISTKLAARLHIDGRSAGGVPIGLQKPIRISIGAEEFSLAAVVVADAAFGAGSHRGKDLILGDDMFQSQLIEIDFPARTLRVILPYERDHYIRHFRPVAVTRGPRGEPQISVSFDGAIPTEALLNLGAETAIAVDAGSVDRLLRRSPIHKNTGGTVIGNVSFGSIEMRNTPITVVKGWEKIFPAEVGLGAFTHVIIDMKDNEIWFN